MSEQHEGLTVGVVGQTIASWTAPSWATSRFVDEGCVEHRTSVGEIAPVGPERAITVDVVQRDDLDAEASTLVRGEAHVSVAGMWLTAAGALELARALDRAAELAETE